MRARTIVPTVPLAGQWIEIPETEAHHLLKVLRMGPGDTLELLDGRGGLCEAALEFRGKKQLFAQNTKTLPPRGKDRVIPVRAELALLKGDAMDWAIEKLTELGVQELFPVLTDHCVVQIKSKTPEEFQERWQKIADQALKQCERLIRMRVHAPQKLQEHWTSQSLQTQELRLWADESAPASSSGSLAAQVTGAWATAKGLRFLVGPEGGFSPAERDWLTRDPDCRPVSLGPWIQRAETAVISACGFAIQSFLARPL